MHKRDSNMHKIPLFSPEFMSYDVRYEPVNFVVSGVGVPKKFKLENLLKKFILFKTQFFFFGEVLVVMCSKHKRNFKN